MADSNSTKSALADAMKKLMVCKSFAKISISDLCEECGLNRKSFYYHFKDIYDLIEWSCEEDSRKAADGNTTYETWQQGLLNIFHAVEENKPFILNIYRHVSQEQIVRYLYRVVYQLIIDVVEECAEGMSVREEDKKFIADFYKYAFVGIMLEWISHNMSQPPEKIVERLSDLIDGDINRMLEKYRTDKPRI